MSRPWTDIDMWEAWSAGAQWAIDRTSIVDGELWLPTDEPGRTNRDWRDECGHWLNDYEAERDEEGEA